MNEARPVTLADIAREAGTSASTASRALSGRGYVSAAARDRLTAVAERLGYVPNASARTLKQRTSRVVGVVVSDLRNQFYARLAAGIEQTLREADYRTMILADNNESAEEAAGARAFLAMRAPGVIMTPVGSDAAELLAAHGIAVVEVERSPATRSCSTTSAARGTRPPTCWASATAASGCSWSRPSGRATPGACGGTAPRTGRHACRSTSG